MGYLVRVIPILSVFSAVVTLSSSHLYNGVDVVLNRTCSRNVDVECFAYYLKSTDCSRVRSAFPKLYNITDNKFPERPKDMILKPYTKLYSNNKYYPGINITLRSPVTASHDIVSGFELMYQPMLSTSTSDIRCWIFDLSMQQLTFETARDTDFFLDLYPIFIKEDPKVMLFTSYTLPKPPLEYDIPDYFQIYPVELPLYGYDNSSPKDWSTSISYQHTNRSTWANNIDVYFSTAPAAFNFKTYELRLVQIISGSEKMVQLVNVSHSGATASYTFRQVPPGEYKIKVQPVNLFFNDPSRCVCRDQIGCGICLVTTTKAFVVHHIPDPSQPTTTHRSTPPNSHSASSASPLAQVQTEETSDPQVFAIIGSIIGVFLVAVLAFLFYFYKHRSSSQRGDRNNRDNNDNYTVIQDENGKNAYDNNMVYDGLRPLVQHFLPKKKIFLAYAEDHQHHTDVLNKFAQFLSRHCRCDVIYAPWCMQDIMQDKFRWVMKSMDDADFVVIVNSVVAFHQFQSWKSKEDMKEKLIQGSPLASLFIPIINQTCIRLNNNPDYRKFIMVRFDYTRKCHNIQDINTGAEFVLMKHLPDFLCYVHSLNQQNIKMEDVGLAFVNDYSQLPEGASLAQAIRKSSSFEEQNPHWYEKERHDSGLGTDDLLETERVQIQQMYEENPHLESISTVLASTGTMDDALIPQFCPPNQEDASGPGFYPPSIIDSNNLTDIASEVLSAQIASFNSRNYTDDNIEFTSGYSNPAIYEEVCDDCVSLGGKSV